QHFVSDVVPKVEDAMAVADKARAKDDVRAIVQDGLNQARILGGIIFQVRVLNDHDGAGGVLEASPQRGALSLIFLLIDDAHAFMLLKFAQNRVCAVGALVIDNNQFLWNRHGFDTAYQLPQPAFFVVDGDDDG